MFVKFTITILCLIISCSLCKAETPVRKCSGNHPLPLYVQIEDCDSLPCEVTRGRVNKMDMQFVAIKDETIDLKAEVHATVFGITVPFFLNEAADVCANLLYGAYCPLYAEEDVVYHLDLPLESSYPELTVKTEVKLVDSSNKDVVTCFVADLKVRRPK